MLKFIYVPESVETVIKTFATGFEKIVRSTNLQTIVLNHYDNDLAEKIMELIEKTEDGFVFDGKDQIGEELYGYVSDFFELYLRLIDKMKFQFGSLGIEGYVFVNDLGSYECVLRQRVYTTPEMDCVEFIDQLQCAACGKWVDTKDAHALIDGDEMDGWPMIDDEPLYPSAYSNSGVEAPFCFCSEECANAMNE